MDITRPNSKQFMPNDARRVYQGIIFDVYQWETTGYDGQIKTFEKLKRPDTVKVIPVTSDGKIILSHQEQPGKDPFVGLLGGRADPNESPLEVAQRELKEESGYTSNLWKLIHASQPVSKIDWAVYIFVAQDCRKTSSQSLDGAEKIELLTLTFEDFTKTVLHSEFDDLELKVMFLEASLDPNKLSILKKSILE